MVLGRKTDAADRASSCVTGAHRRDRELGRSARLRSEETLHAERLGFLHLSAAQCAARSQQHDNAQAHLAEAAAIAARARIQAGTILAGDQ